MYAAYLDIMLSIKAIRKNSCGGIKVSYQAFGRVGKLMVHDDISITMLCNSNALTNLAVV